MNTLDATALQCLHDFEQAHPGAAILARYASLATRVDASLLRRLRLQMLPGLDAAAEADLWFSDLSQSRDGEALVLDPDIAALLRERLRTERLPDGRRALDRAYEVMRVLHLGWPASLQLEETLIYLALRQGSRAVGRIEALLRPAIAAMSSQPERGLEISRWVLRAMPTLPALVRESEAARAMAVTAAAMLGADSSLLAGLESHGLPASYRWLLPADALVERTRLRCRLSGSDLLFQPALPGDPDDACIDLPATRPLMLELQSGLADGQAARLIGVVPGVPVVLPQDWRQISLVCVDGQAYQLIRDAQWPAKSDDELPVDVFISSARRDDQPLGASDKGWVSLLHDALVALLRNRLQRSVRVWRGATASEDAAPSTLQMAFGARVFLCVVSPAYLASDWCMRELQAFLDFTRDRQGATKVSRPKVFKLLTEPVDDGRALPAELRQTLGYEFFDMQDRGPRLLHPSLGESSRQRFLQKVSDLAADIAGLLSEADTPDPRELDALPISATVYLAECAADLRPLYERLRSELQAHGHRVLPQAPLPRDEEAFRAEVVALLEQATLSLHLVGRSNGPVLDGSDDLSATMLQNELAARQSQRNGLSRLVWIAESGRDLQSTQQALVDRLLHDHQAQFGADVLMGSFEDLRNALHSTLHKLVTATRPARAGGSGLSQVCVLFDAADKEAVQPLLDWCMSADLALLLPAFEGSAADVRHATRRALTDCDAVIVFLGMGSELWLQAMQAEFRKADAWRRSPLRARYLYVDGPQGSERQRLIDLPRLDGIAVIDGSAGLDNANMAEFLRSLRSERESA